jgi:hypothetical protein
VHSGSGAMLKPLSQLIWTRKPCAAGRCRRRRPRRQPPAAARQLTRRPASRRCEQLEAAYSECSRRLGAAWGVDVADGIAARSDTPPAVSARICTVSLRSPQRHLRFTEFFTIGNEWAYDNLRPPPDMENAATGDPPLLRWPLPAVDDPTAIRERIQSVSEAKEFLAALNLSLI